MILPDCPWWAWLLFAILLGLAWGVGQEVGHQFWSAFT